MITISVINLCPSITKIELAAGVAGINEQMAKHFCPAWGLDGVKLTIARTDIPAAKAIPDGNWLLFLRPEAGPPGVAANHSEMFGGLPQLNVYLAALGAIPWTLAASHEVCEAVIDPNILTPRLALDQAHQRAFIVEVCDPVADTSDGNRPIGYATSNGTIVSNFTLPTYWNFGAKHTQKADYLGVLPVGSVCPTFAPGGYLGVYADGQWSMMGSASNALLEGLGRHAQLPA